MPNTGKVLLIPNTVSLVRDCPHPALGKQLIDYLLRPETEGLLAAGESGQYPLHPRTPVPPQRIPLPAAVKFLEFDSAQAAVLWPQASRFLRELLTEGVHPTRRTAFPTGSARAPAALSPTASTEAKAKEASATP